MKDKSEIIRELQAQAKYYYAEGERCEKAASILSEGIEANTITGITNKYSDYQVKWGPLEKIKYIESIHNRFWSFSQMEETLIEIEGKEQAKIVMPNLTQYVYRAIRECDVVKMKYEGKRAIFFSTHQEWVEHTPEEEIKYRVIEKYAPNPSLLQKLSAEQLSPDRIMWEGVKY